MQHASVVAIVEALNAAGVRYLIVGGLAVAAHGHVRFTADVDLVLDMSDGNLATGRPQDLLDVEQLLAIRSAGVDHG